MLKVSALLQRLTQGGEGAITSRSGIHGLRAVAAALGLIVGEFIRAIRTQRVFQLLPGLINCQELPVLFLYLLFTILVIPSLDVFCWRSVITCALPTSQLLLISGEQLSFNMNLCRNLLSVMERKPRLEPLSVIAECFNIVPLFPHVVVHYHILVETDEFQVLVD